MREKTEGLEKKGEKIIKIVFLFGGSILSGMLAANYGLKYMGIGLLLSVLLYAVLLFKMNCMTVFDGEIQWKKEVMALLWAIASVYICVSGMKSLVEKALAPYLGEHIKINLVIAIIAITIIPYFYLIYRRLIAKVGGGIYRIYRSFTKEEMIFFWAHIGIMTLLLFFLYQKTSAFSYATFISESGKVIDQSANAILNTDSSFLLKRTCSVANGGDIRHPLWIMIQLPFTSIAFAFSYLLPAFELIYPAIQCLLINICLTFCIILLERLIGNKWSLILYGVSYPFILYGLLFETSQIAACLSVILVYSICTGTGKEKDKSSLVAIAAGYTSTSCVLAIFLEKVSDIKKFFGEAIKCALKFFTICVLWGQSYLLLHLWDEISKMLQTYGSAQYTFRDRLVAFSHSMAAAFVAVPYRIYKEPREQYHYFSYYLTIWRKEVKLEWLGVIVLFFALMGFIWNYKKRFAQICFAWLIYHFVIFVLVGYSAGDFTVHIMLYSWAIVALVFMALQKLLDKLKCRNENVIFALLALVILVKNLEFLIDICQYAIERFPVNL